MLQLSPIKRRELKARAHSLNPVVSISEENGLTDAVMREIDICLKAHELIKIRVYGDSRENRIACYDRICEELGAAPVQHIGKLLVVWRPIPQDQKPVRRPQRTTPRRTKRSFQG